MLAEATFAFFIYMEGSIDPLLEKTLIFFEFRGEIKNPCGGESTGV